MHVGVFGEVFVDVSIRAALYIRLVGVPGHNTNFGVCRGIIFLSLILSRLSLERSVENLFCSIAVYNNTVDVANG